MSGLTIYDWSDREMLANVEDCLNADGYTTSDDVADFMDIRANGSNRSPGGLISSRLAWMARPNRKLLEKLDPKLYGRKSNERLWRITQFGYAILRGKLSTTAERTIQHADPGASLLIMRLLTQQAYVNGSEELAAAVRREYQHTASRRPGASRRS